MDLKFLIWTKLYKILLAFITPNMQVYYEKYMFQADELKYNYVPFYIGLIKIRIDWLDKKQVLCSF